MSVLDWKTELQLAHPIDDPCPNCGGQLRRYRCRCFCDDCLAVIHAIWPLQKSGWHLKREDEP